MARQLTANEPFDISGPAGALIGRAAHFVKGVTSGGSMPGGSMMSKMMPGAGGAAAEGGAAEGAAGAAGAGEAAAGIGELAELAPLAAL